MKKAFFALTAVLAAGIASAITFDWGTALATTTNSATSASLSSSQQSSVSSTGTTTSLYGALVSGGLPGGDRAIFGVSNGTTLGTSQAITVSINANGQFALAANGTIANTNSSYVASAIGTSTTTVTSLSSYYLVLEVTRTSSGETYVALYGSTDGTNYDTLIASTETSAISSETTFDTIWAANYLGATGGGAAYGAATSIAVYANDTETTVIPEPTVLALLALGVAGLALKRKVA